MTDNGPRTGIRSRSAGLVLAVIGLLIGGWMVVNSRFFAVDRVVVRGGGEVAAAEVVALADVPEGTNLIRLATDAVAVRVEGHPWIADAAVSRDLPSTLVIRIRERRPSGWLRDGDRVLLVAGDGGILEHIDREPRDVPALGDGGAGLAPGAMLSSRPDSLTVAATMPPSLLAEAAAIADSAEGLVVSLRGGGEVWYGGGEELAGKHRAAASILGWARERDVAVRVVDVRVPSAPTLDPAGGGDRISIPQPPSND